MSYDLFAIPVTRPIVDATEYDLPGVVRTLTIDEYRDSLLPVFPAGYPWSAGVEWVNWRSPEDGSRLEVSVAKDGKCAYLRGVGTSGVTWEAVKRVAGLPGWTVFDPQTLEFVRPG